MQQEVTIRISGSQTAQGDTHRSEMTTRGRLERLEDGYVLCYEEGGLAGHPGPFVIRVDGDVISLLHRDPQHANLTFFRDRPGVNAVQTPYGMLEVEVYPKRVDSRLDDRGGQLELDYELSCNGNFLSSHNMQVRFHV
jgi:uncharacterized beta-barrel protein YwiB (DUF1934 family)